MYVNRFSNGDRCPTRGCDQETRCIRNEVRLMLPTDDLIVFGDLFGCGTPYHEFLQGYDLDAVARVTMQGPRDPHRKCADYFGEDPSYECASNCPARPKVARS